MDDFDYSNDIDRILNAGGDLPDIPEQLSDAPAFPLASTPRVETATPILKAPKVPATSSKATATERFVETTKDESDRKDSAGESSAVPRQLPADELPREKALRLGINALSDNEVLAILLGSGIPGKSVFELSEEILAANGHRLAILSRMTIPEIMRKYKGIGLAKATLLVAAMNFGARAQRDLAIPDPQIASSRSVYDLMREKLERQQNEEFWILHLNRANRVTSQEQISKGGITQTAVDIKLIAKSAIDRLSSAIILVHNHPSGNMIPSGPDDALTRRIVEICKIVDVKVLDHVIIGPSGFYSYTDHARL